MVERRVPFSKVVNPQMQKLRKAATRVPLAEAAWKFAPPGLRREFARLQGLPSPDFSPGEPSDRIDAFKKLMNIIRLTMSDASLRNQPLTKMRDNVIARLCDEELEAWGILIEPQFGDGMEKLPAFIFKGHPRIDWNANSIKNFGKKYEAIEIWAATTERSSSTATQPNIHQPRGRPRVDELIREVVLKLRASGQFIGKTQKQKIHLVQRLAQQNHKREFPTETRPSPTKIRTVLRLEGE